MTEQVSCDLYQLEELVESNRINRKEDIRLFEQLEQRGYLEGNGYAWAQPRAAEVEAMCKRVREGFNNNK